MTLDPTYPTVAPPNQPKIHRRRLLPALFGVTGVFLLCGGTKSAAAEQLTPSTTTAPDAPADVSPTRATPANSKSPLPAPANKSGKSADGAHYPSFAIGSDGVIRRTLAPSPVLPSFQTILKAPYLSQFDGSAYAQTNCGPTSLAMALGALGVPAQPLALRALANKQMGTSDPDNGTSWESLAYAAKQNGVTVFGVTNPGSKGYRQWSMNDLLGELEKHRPVLMLIRYWDLPDHQGSSFSGDHYIVALGTDGANTIVYNDPASNAGAYVRITTDKLQHAWRDPASGIATTAMSVYR